MKPATLAPMYATLLPPLSEAARSVGYALAVHGTMARDLDVVAIPWTDKATSAEEVVRAMAETVARRAGDDLVIGYPHSSAPTLPHGRQCYSIPFRMGGEADDPGYVDVAVMPRAASPAPVIGGEESER
jgi:hypothetical protein